jgi:hypothetical protein
MDYEGFVANGTMLGSGGVIVIDDAQNLVKQIARAARFFAHESCAQCTQCREGHRVDDEDPRAHRRGEGSTEDLETLLEIGENMTGKTICVLSDSCATPVASGLQKFRGDFRGAHQEEEGAHGARAGGLMADVKMVNLTIEGRPVAVPDGTSILEAAKDGGRADPALLLSPGLPVAACAACASSKWRRRRSSRPPARRRSPRAGGARPLREGARARKGVLEMLLINHPLDCPICDQAGECELQDYTYQEGPREGRYRDPKRFNPVEDFGGDVVYVANRCILCTRCVGSWTTSRTIPVLSVAERGDRALIGKVRGARTSRTAGPGNVIDLCPGRRAALKDSLNKARAWELDRRRRCAPTARRAAT